MLLSTRILIVLGLLFLPALAVFLIWPDLDLHISALLIREDGKFLFAHSLGWVIYDEGVRPAFRFAVAGLILWVLWLLWRHPARRRFVLRRFLFVALVALIGPVLIVEAGLKSHSGRARPTDVTEFSGEQHYSPPFVFTDQCDTNCSFVSGDAAAAFAAFALALLAGRWRGFWMGSAIVLGLVIGAWRMAVGGHFFSDVIIAGFISVAVATICYRVMIESAHGQAAPTTDRPG